MHRVIPIFINLTKFKLSYGFLLAIKLKLIINLNVSIIDTFVTLAHHDFILHN